MINLSNTLKNNLENEKETWIILLNIEIDIISYIAKLWTKKLEKTIKAINKILAKKISNLFRYLILNRILLLLLLNDIVG